MVKSLEDRMNNLCKGIKGLIIGFNDYLIAFKIAAYGPSNPKEEEFAKMYGIMGPKRIGYSSSVLNKGMEYKPNLGSKTDTPGNS